VSNIMAYTRYVTYACGHRGKRFYIVFWRLAFIVEWALKEEQAHD